VNRLSGEVDSLSAELENRDTMIGSLKSQLDAAGSDDDAIAALNGTIAERDATIGVGDNVSVEIGGHTDDRGSEESNQLLSEQRAQAVRDFMTARGVDTSGLTAVGYGEANPIADNETAEGQAANRRISFDWQAR